MRRVIATLAAAAVGILLAAHPAGAATEVAQDVLRLNDCKVITYDPPATVQTTVQVRYADGTTAEQVTTDTPDAQHIVHVDVANIIEGHKGEFRAWAGDIPADAVDYFVKWQPFDCAPVTPPTTTPPTTVPPAAPPVDIPPPAVVTKTPAPAPTLPVCDPNDVDRCGMPNTGASDLPLTLGGIGLMTLGGLLIWASRRRPGIAP